MEMTTHQRPGVYSAYDVSSAGGGRRGNMAVGIVAQGSSDNMGTLCRVTRYEEAVGLYGASAKITELVRLALLNGAGAVSCVEVVSEDMYVTAMALLGTVEDVTVMLCDSTRLGVQQDLREAVVEASKGRRERIGVIAGESNETATAMVTRVASINSERIVMLAPPPAGANGISLAAAFAGALAAEPDPAVPMSGVALKGVGPLARRYRENEVDQLILGGVTPLEEEGGIVSVVRAVTTKTKVGQTPDSTWRELTTVRIVDDVIPSIRNELKVKFRRAKNTEQTRGAIRSQVVMALERKRDQEIIDGYGQVTVTAKEEDPTVCLVEFSFAVAHGLNQIWLSAHITV